MRALDISSPGPDLARIDHLRQAFLALYPNRQQSIVKDISAKSWVTVSKFHTLTDDELAAAVSCETRLLRGCRWAEQTKFSVLDIDAGSPHHNVEELRRLRQSLSAAGISRTCLYQSSSSGGWHLYIFWDLWADSLDNQTLLKRYLASEGFQIAGGKLEVFPAGSALRLPLQAGFAWLADDLTVKYRRDEMSSDLALRQFLFDQSQRTNDWNLVRERLTTMLDERSRSSAQDDQEQLEQFADAVSDAYHAIERSRWEKGRRLWMRGLTDKNQRHDAILYVGYYLWFGDPGQGLSPLPGRRAAATRERLIRNWLRDKHNGHCSHINKGDWKKVEADINRAVHWRRTEAMRQRVPYLVTDRLIERQMQANLTLDQMQKANEKREREAREKIREAVRELSAAGQNVSLKAVQRLSGCSLNTVRRHRDLLQPGGSGEYSPGGFESPVSLDQVRKDKEEKRDLIPSQEVQEPAETGSRVVQLRLWSERGRSVLRAGSGSGAGGAGGVRTEVSRPPPDG